eukprot:Rmarinus@m.21692
MARTMGTARRMSGGHHSETQGHQTQTADVQNNANLTLNGGSILGIPFDEIPALDGSESPFNSLNASVVGSRVLNEGQIVTQIPGPLVSGQNPSTAGSQPVADTPQTVQQNPALNSSAGSSTQSQSTQPISVQQSGSSDTRHLNGPTLGTLFEPGDSCIREGVSALAMACGAPASGDFVRHMREFRGPLDTDLANQMLMSAKKPALVCFCRALCLRVTGNKVDLCRRIVDALQRHLRASPSHGSTVRPAGPPGTPATQSPAPQTPTTQPPSTSVRLPQPPPANSTSPRIRASLPTPTVPPPLCASKPKTVVRLGKSDKFRSEIEPDSAIAQELKQSSSCFREYVGNVSSPKGVMLVIGKRTRVEVSCKLGIDTLAACRGADRTASLRLRCWKVVRQGKAYSRCVEAWPYVLLHVNHVQVVVPNSAVRESGIDLSNSLRAGQNQVVLTMQPSAMTNMSDMEYVVSIQRMRELSDEAVVERTCTLQRNTMKRSKELVLAAVGGDDCDVVQTSTRFTLLDPLLLARIAIPVRGKGCVHPLCFDLKAYVQAQRRVKQFRCPICNSPVPVADLRVCPLFEEIIQNTASNVREIEVDNDGQYHVVKVEEVEDVDPPNSDEEATQDTTVLSAHEKDASSKSTCAPSATENESGRSSESAGPAGVVQPSASNVPPRPQPQAPVPSEPADVIDLTLSDDEPDVPLAPALAPNTIIHIPSAPPRPSASPRKRLRKNNGAAIISQVGQIQPPGISGLMLRLPNRPLRQAAQLAASRGGQGGSEAGGGVGIASFGHPDMTVDMDFSVSDSDDYTYCSRESPPYCSSCCGYSNCDYSEPEPEF